MTRQPKNNLPGCIFSNNGRFWWRVRLPGEQKKTARPLKPIGAKFATNDRAVALEIAREMYDRAIFSAGIMEPNPEGQEWDGWLATLIKMFLVHAGQRYVRADGSQTGEAGNIRWGLECLIDYCPKMQAADFGPLKLEEVRQKMIDAKLARSVINQRVNIIRRMFRWATKKQLVPASTWHGLLAVEGLRKGTPGVKEPRPIQPVDEAIVQATLPFLSPIVADMVRIQQLTGMRSGELVIMRPMDIEKEKSVWLYRPASHKTAHHGHSRAIVLGPKAQKILKKYLDRPSGAFIFSPVESEKQRRKEQNRQRTTPRDQGNVPGSNVKEKPLKKPGEAYSPQSYAKSISYACKAAKVPHWHPHQIRHAAATRLRQAFEKKGLDVARAVLGHRSLGMTDHYAEIDLALAIQAAKKIG